MEQEILNEILKNCKDWRERVLIRMFPKIFAKVYKKGIKEGFKWSNKTVQ